MKKLLLSVSVILLFIFYSFFAKKTPSQLSENEKTSLSNQIFLLPINSVYIKKRVKLHASIKKR